jgi:hypothetical protein
VNHWSPVTGHNEKGARKKERMVRKGHEESWKDPIDVETDVQEVWFAGGHVRFYIIILD